MSTPTRALEPAEGDAGAGTLLRRGEARYRMLLLALFAAGVVTFAQLYAPQSVLPLIEAEPGWDLSASQAALTISAATFGLAASVLVWAVLAKRFGAFPIICASLTLTTVMSFAVAVAPDFGVLLAIRVLQGIGAAGMAALAVAYIVERVSPRDVPVVAGIYVSGTTIGGLSGRIAGAALAGVADWRGSLLGVALISLLFAGLFIYAGWRSRPRPATEAGATPSADHAVATTTATDLVECLTHRPVAGLYLLIFVLMGSLVALYNYFAFHLADPPYDLSAARVGLFYFAYLGGTVGARLAGSAAGRFGRGTTLAVAVTLMLAGAGVTLLDELGALAAGLLLFTTAFFAAHAVASGWVGQIAGPQRSATASALYSLFYYAGSAVLGWLFGFPYEHFGWTIFVLVLLGGCIAAALLSWALLRSTGPGSARSGVS
ncbi:MFS transporter [Nocardia jinanensis]|uniref:MFS transporter n=1 Tax=Nocardia jinanensis TaxID=382504 RepID=UPI000A8CEE03|nr:MFS transporter [Nocardia jinanensis]